ncbi:MAG: UDP-N-acetylglucosamine diphosphorylase, partial [Pseudoflavonifractor sp.]
MAVSAIVFLPREGDLPSAMLEDVLFDPAARWLCAALEGEGAEDFFVACHADDRAAAERCFPKGTLYVTTGSADAAQRLGSFLAQHEGRVLVATRPIFLSSNPQSGAENTGFYEIDAATLAAGGDLETALQERGKIACPGRALPLPRQSVLRDALAQSESLARMETCGVRVIGGSSVFVGPRVQVGRGSSLLPGTILKGDTFIGSGCTIGPNTVISDCVIGNAVTVNASQLNESAVEDEAKIGPFAYVRPGCHVGRGVKVGDFVELKNSTIGSGTKISHLTYVGDSDVGDRVNFGCGTVTVNYDGSTKFRTSIGDGAFIGCNTNLVAPVNVGAGAYTAAGSTITDDVPADSLAIARSQQTNKKQWAAKRRKRNG